MLADTYQYAVKIIQGTVQQDAKRQPIAPGLYFTSVNVHNPGPRGVEFIYKLALSYPKQMISKWKSVGLKDDQAIQFDNNTFYSMLNGGSLSTYWEGFFVIESSHQLDVEGVYTGSTFKDKQLAAMHLERVPARTIKVGLRKISK